MAESSILSQTPPLPCPVRVSAIWSAKFCGFLYKKSDPPRKRLLEPIQDNGFKGRGFTYLFPARGRKLFNFSHVTVYCCNKFHLPIPRKGTETILGIIGSPLTHAEFHLPIPRKGTETTKYSPSPQERLNHVSLTYSPQGDGNIHPMYSALTHCSFHLPIPRKGTETSSQMTEAAQCIAFHLPIPRKGTETKYYYIANFFLGFVSLTYSPQGDGNISSCGYVPALIRNVSLTYSPQGDGNYIAIFTYMPNFVVSLTYSPQGDGNTNNQCNKLLLNCGFTYLFPARGRKPLQRPSRRGQLLKFHLPIPRKGTETFFFPNHPIIQVQFHLPIPRKGTETKLQTLQALD